MALKLTDEVLAKYRAGEFISCHYFHTNSCEFDALKRFFLMSKFTALLYGPAHFLPMLIFRPKQVLKDPITNFGRAIKNTLRSMLFGCSIIALTKYGFCLTNKLFRGAHRYNWLVMGPLSTASIFIEARSRVAELTLYLLPRTIETVWNILVKYGVVKSLKYGEVLVMSIALGILMYFVHNEPQFIKPTYRSTLQLIYGKN